MKRLRDRVFFQILIPTLVIFILLITAGYLIYIKSYKESVIEKKQEEFLNVSRLFSDWVSSRMRELMLISSSGMFSGENNEESREYLADRLKRQFYKFSSFWIIDESGFFRSTNNMNGRLPNTDQISRLFMREKLFLYEIPSEYLKYSTERFILFAVPVPREGKVNCLLGGTISVSEFNWMLDLYTHNMFDSAALINLDIDNYQKNGGIIIAHSNEFLNGKNEVDVFGGVYSGSRQNRNESFFITSLISNWKFIGEISNAQLFYQINAFSRFFFIVMFFLILAIGVLSIGISQLIARPVVSLTDMVNKMLMGDFTHTIAVKTNDELTSLANAFNLLNRRNIQLRTNDRFSFLGKISSRMAHEIRHPLHVIQVALETLSLDNIEKTREIMNHEIKKAELFIREILEIAKPNELSLQYFSMKKLLHGISKKYELLEEETGIKLVLKLEAEFDSFYFDVLKIEQVITNIINNSLDMLKSDGTVTISLSNDTDKHLILTISDSGPGFDLSLLDRVFDPYFTTKEDGVGLGLSICYQILTAHEAHIELRNSAEGGAETSIIFSSLSE